MPTAAEVTAARTRTNVAIAAAAAGAIDETSTTIAAVIGSHNDLAIARMTIRAREAMQGLLDDMAAASSAETALGTQRETQAQIQALTDLINRLQAAQATAPTETAAEPIVAAPTTSTTPTTSMPPALTPPAAEKSHAMIYVGLGIAGLTLAGSIAYFTLRSKPATHPRRNPWNSRSDAPGGAAR